MATVKKIMVAVDESEHSRYALEWTLANLHLYGPKVSLIAFHAEPYVVLTSSAEFTAPALTQALTDQQKRITKTVLAQAEELCAQKNVTVETFSEVGDPREVICKACENLNVDLLIVGSHGYGMIKRALLGSVSSYCVQAAKCPVLVAKKP